MAEIRARVQTLLEGSRYNKSILPQLHEAVHSQVQDGWYDLEVNLAILKLYQFHPEEGVVDVDVLCKILAMALMNLPEPDFRLCMYLIPDRFLQIDLVRTQVSLAEKLEACKFKDFWQLVKQSPETFSLVPGFEDSVRKFIVNTTAITYGEIPVEVLGDLVSLNEAQLDKLMSENGITCKGGIAYFTKTEENQSKPVVFEQVTQLTQVSQVLSSLAS